MSNNLISQFSISDRQVVQMDHGDLPVQDMHMKMVGQVSSNPESLHFYVSTEHRGFVEPISSNPGLNNIMIPNNGVGHNESSGMLSSPIWVSDQLGHEFANMQNGMTGEKTSLPVKRKAEVGPLVDNTNSQQALLPNKRPAHVGTDHNSHGFLQPSAPQRKYAPAQSKLSSPGPPSQHSQNKKMVRNDSTSGKSGPQRGQVAKKQTAQIESASKVRPESSEGVRSKMRESLAGALALAFQNQDNVPNTEKNQSDAAITHQPMDSQASESNSTKGVHVPVSGSEEVSKTNDSQVFSGQLHPNGSSGNGGQVFQDFQYGSSLPDEGVSFGDTFFAKDDLLQGNGLSWAFEFDLQMGEGKEAQQADKTKSVKEEAQGHRGEVPTLTPENLAFKIEAELFKLFGGVNKKYREKGRSLLFNLKDRNNPELRERVMSGEISPERLCSMSAEELASKELSEWRMAKAEELAQMKVLPDTEVDIRRLVRKTHKGEYQVEVEHDDGIAAEVSGGASVLTQHQSKKESEPNPPSEASLKDKEKVAGQDNSSEDQDFPGSLIIPTDGTDETDLMQGMMVDELKDAEFLPPIVSLDEFMESLNNEPPFENLSVDAAGQKTSTSHGESPKPGSVSRASTRALDSPKDTSSKKPVDVKKQDVATKSSGSPAKHKVLPSAVPKVEYMWDGILQLSLSSTVTVGGLFQSGEKTSTKEWPSSLEIKGRVRLDAFEKFLQDLPMSRTRAVMVLQFVLKDKSSDEERANLSEAIDSYSTDDRLGYAEPASGVELYLCPPTSRMTEMLAKYMPKEQRPDSNNPIENTLIGVVVWRRAHISNNKISPNSSSHHKHASKRQQPFAPPPKRVQDSSNVNPNSTPTRTTPPFNKAQTEEEDEDIPPGFGPVAAARAAKDDDDLPEFNFSGNLTPSVPRSTPLNLQQKMSHRPVDQVRELIKKYGQSDTSATSSSPISSRGFVDNRNLGIEPWNDDDDDDIPEWRPQAPLQPHHHPNAVLLSHRPPAHLAPTNKHMAAQPPPGGLSHPPPAGGRWVQPPGPLHGSRWRH